MKNAIEESLNEPNSCLLFENFYLIGVNSEKIEKYFQENLQNIITNLQE